MGKSVADGVNVIAPKAFIVPYGPTSLTSAVSGQLLVSGAALIRFNGTSWVTITES